MITNNRITDQGWGIKVELSDCVIITNNLCEVRKEGISLYWSNNLTIENNVCLFCLNYGIRSWGSNNSYYINNTLKDGYIGLLLYFNINCYVVNNTCSTNSLDAIILSGCDQVRIESNICTQNNGCGIRLKLRTRNTTSCLITYNFLSENDFGVILEENTFENQVYCNIFKNNKPSFPQACDNGTNNLWYNASIHKGNYWSDYSGVGAYQIYGSAGSNDLFPLTEPTVPEINTNNFFLISSIVLIVLSVVFLRRKKKIFY